MEVRRYQQRLNPFEKTFEDLLLFLERKCKEPLLAQQIRHFVHLIHYSSAHLIVRLTPDAPQNFVHTIKRVLDHHTKQSWTIQMECTGGEKTLAKQEKEQKAYQKDQRLKHPLVLAIREAFPEVIIHT